jgi:hypothetical protein
LKSGPSTMVMAIIVRSSFGTLRHRLMPPESGDKFRQTIFTDS